jgi:hypothetical protein
MDKIDLRKLWSETHTITQQNIHDEVNIRKTLKMNHSRIISKVLSELKLKIAGYSLLMIILISLMVYALVYLDLNLSDTTLILFTFIGLFFAQRIVSIITRLFVMTRTANNLSLKESVLFFRRKLNRIKVIDFISYLLYFYTLTILLIYNYINDIGGVKNLSRDNEIQTLVLIAILMLLSIPWLLKYQNNQRYKKIYSSLNDSANFLNDAT